MKDLYCVEKKLFIDGDKVENFMRESGFVDIEIRIVKVEIGEWGTGSFTI
jgi:hypothetical protein